MRSVLAPLSPKQRQTASGRRFALYMEVSTPLVDEVSDLAERSAHRGSVIAFQSTLAAAARAVEQALRSEEAVEAAALSLAQQGALHDMTAQLRAASEALVGQLDRHGRCLMPPGEPKKRRGLSLARFHRSSGKQEDVPRPTWWFSLAEAIDTLEEGAERMDALTAGQADACPSRQLGEATAHLLRHHHDRLVGEADRWID